MVTKLTNLHADASDVDAPATNWQIQRWFDLFFRGHWSKCKKKQFLGNYGGTDRNPWT